MKAGSNQEPACGFCRLPNHGQDPLTLVVAPVVQYVFEEIDFGLGYAHEHIACEVRATPAKAFLSSYMFVPLCGHLRQVEDDT